MGLGLNAATPTSFTDFRPFGGFNTPLLKQYAQNINVCGICTSLSVYNNVAMKDLPANMKFEMTNVTVGNLSSILPIMVSN